MFLLLIRAANAKDCRLLEGWTPEAARRVGRSNVVMPRAAGSVVQCGGSRNVGSRAGNAIGKGNRDQQTGADSASELRVSCGDGSGVVIVVMVREPSRSASPLSW